MPLKLTAVCKKLREKMTIVTLGVTLVLSAGLVSLLAIGSNFGISEMLTSVSAFALSTVVGVIITTTVERKRAKEIKEMEEVRKAIARMRKEIEIMEGEGSHHPALLRVEDEVVFVLMQALEAPDALVRRAAVEALGEIGRGIAVGVLSEKGGKEPS